MEKNAYLVISDTHFGEIAAKSRIDYRKENQFVVERIIEIAVKYRRAGYCVKFLFLGDIYHHSYKNVFNAIADHDVITVLKESIGECFTVLGNHELTYYQANPFYTLVSEIESERVQRIMNRVWQPLGAKSILRVVDTLEDGEVQFYFNHYGTGIQDTKESGVRIGLFHQDLADKSVQEFSKNEYGVSVFGNGIDLDNSALSGYDYCFFGHMHSLYGKFRSSNNTILHYLGSLGRTSVSEVRDEFLERCIPVVLVEDGKFQRVDDNCFQLPTRQQCVFESEATKSHEEYEKRKEVQKLRRYVPESDDPIVNLYSIFAEDAMASGILKDLAVNDFDEVYHGLKRRYEVYLV